MLLKTINNAKSFFQDYASPIYIYGGGNPGYLVSKYMDKCNLNYHGYIDIAVGAEELYLEGKKVIHPEILNSCTEEELRIIIAIGQPDEAISTLHWYVRNNIKLICLTPFYMDFVLHKKMFDINNLLSYFRSKLLNVNNPTIISNTCIAGFIYKDLGQPMLSPTINTGIKPESFLKICKNPKYYFQEDMVFSHWALCNGIKCPVGVVRDVEVIFGHENDLEKAIPRWNKMRKWIDWDNIIYILEENNNFPLSYRIAKEFCSISAKHLLVLKKEMYGNGELKGTMYVPNNNFYIRESAVENWFDLLGWINGEFEL